MNPYGDVHAFRMSLFTEHFRNCEEVFIHPGRMECVQKIKQLAYINWQQYTASQPGSQTTGQMLPYPLNVMPDGSLEYLEGFKTFPDFKQGAKVKGTPSAVIPQKVTT
jgi:phospholipase D1/2